MEFSDILIADLSDCVLAKEDALHKVNERVMHCKSCPLWAIYIRDVGKIKTKQYRDQDYWAKPVPTFCDPKAKLLVVGLAPAANGANRTGNIHRG
jgi:uracil-DNA glycosylase